MAPDPFDQFVTLFVTVDPIANVPIFLALCGRRTHEQMRRSATRAVVCAALILLAFMLGGRLLLTAMGIGLESFRIAGGIVLFIVSLKMIFADEARDAVAHAGSYRDPAISPMAIPIIAGPGTILATVVLADASRGSVRGHLVTAGVILSVLLIQWVLLWFAPRVQKMLGESGTLVLTRIMGLVLAALSVEIAVGAVRSLLAGP